MTYRVLEKNLMDNFKMKITLILTEEYLDCEETKGRNPHFFKNLFFCDFGILSHPASTSDFEKIPSLLLSAIQAIINLSLIHISEPTRPY